MESLVAYLVAAMVSWVPLYAHKAYESQDDARTRYEGIARAAAAVALDEGETPVFGGPQGRSLTALLMMAVASYESSFRKGVDEGTVLGDHGRSFCLMQVRVGDGTTREGWTGPQLIEDRTRCFRAALHILRGSFGACRDLAVEDRLSAYATGRCSVGEPGSRWRVGRARAWWQQHAAPVVPRES